uniref:Major facilitator superfamily (MFS) profile domain-containing protein n=1 Tax=Setaria digitata TaxID=48799 RepID=A0A915PIM6_9BILA
MMDDEDSQLLITTTGSSKRKFATVGVLLLINLLNYMDRFTVAGVLTQIEKYFNINDSSAGLLQTVFVVFYMLFAPFCGYYGDRYNRKLIMEIGLIVWVLAVLSSTFCGPAHFYLFILCRGIVGIGEASYVTVAPTIIADMYKENQRSIALMVFYFAVPVGSGLGYAAGSSLSLWTNTWQWGIRLTPVLGIICFLLLFFVIEEPVRGESEFATFMPSSFLADIKYLLTVPTYIFTTFGLTAVVFVVGCLAWWTPTLLQYAWAVHHGTSHVSSEVKAEIGLEFGIITCFAGFLGVFCGSTLSQLIQVVLIFDVAKVLLDDPNFHSSGGRDLAVSQEIFMQISMFIFALLAITGCCVNWAVSMDILMSVISLRRRSMASAIQTLVSHLFGDAFSPYLIGLISDAVCGRDQSVLAHFIALQRSLFVPNFVLCFAGLMYLVSTFYIDQDRRNADELTHGEQLTFENDSDISPFIDAVEHSLRT